MADYIGSGEISGNTFDNVCPEGISPIASGIHFTAFDHGYGNMMITENTFLRIGCAAAQKYPFFF